MQHDGIDGILYLVGNAAGHASAGREAAGHLDFVSDAAHRLGVAHDQQSADLSALFLNKIQRDLDAPAGGSDKLALRERTPVFKSIQHRGSERRVAGEDFLYRSAQQFGARPAEEALDRRAHQHHAGVSREQHQAVLQLRHELVHVVFQGGKNFPAVAHLPAQVGDLQRDQPEFVVFRFVSRECLGCTRTDAIQVAADLLERSESEIGHAGGEQEERRKSTRSRNKERAAGAA